MFGLQRLSMMTRELSISSYRLSMFGLQQPRTHLSRFGLPMLPLEHVRVATWHEPRNLLGVFRLPLEHVRVATHHQRLMLSINFLVTA